MSLRFVLGLLFLATIPLANWMIDHVGYCSSAGPCVLPVWPGVMAPSGVLVVGLALVLRDAVHERAGAGVTTALIWLGAAVSVVLAPPALAFASVAAFTLSEMADLAVYTPLRERKLWLAVMASGAVGAVVDSVLFLWLAFGSLEYLTGQVLGKLWATALVAVVLAWRRR